MKKTKRKPRQVCWLVTYLANQTYMTQLFKSSSKGETLYNEIINIGVTWARSVSTVFTGCVIVSIAKLN